VNGWRGVCAQFGSRFAGNGSVLILDGHETVEGGLFVSFEVWFTRNGAICIANMVRGGILGLVCAKRLHLAHGHR